LSRALGWFGNVGIYWVNFRRLAFVHILGKAWFLVSLLRVGFQYKARGRARLMDPYRVEQGIGEGYRSYGSEQLRNRLQRR
jgi:hypothetical protein